MCTACPREFRLFENAHEQACAARRFGYPDHAAPYGERPRGHGLRQTGFRQRSRARKMARKARERVGNGGQPGIGLFRQLCRMNLGQQGCRQAFEESAGRSLGNQAERRVFVIVSFVRRDARHQPARFAAQQMLRRRLLHPVLEFDQEQVDGAPIDEPDTVRVVELHRQVAGAGHGRTGASGELGDRRVCRPCELHQPDVTSL